MEFHEWMINGSRATFLAWTRHVIVTPSFQAVLLSLVSANMDDVSLKAAMALWAKTNEEIHARLTTSKSEWDTLRSERDELKLAFDALQADRDAVLARLKVLEGITETQTTIIRTLSTDHAQCPTKDEVDVLRAERIWLKEKHLDLRASLAREVEKSEGLERKLDGIGASVSWIASRGLAGI